MTPLLYWFSTWWGPITSLVFIHFLLSLKLYTWLTCIILIIVCKQEKYIEHELVLDNNESVSYTVSVKPELCKKKHTSVTTIIVSPSTINIEYIIKHWRHYFDMNTYSRDNNLQKWYTCFSFQIQWFVMGYQRGFLHMVSTCYSI